ncbi:cupin domain-containing protein [Portibacter lacus]|uniref:Cupin n=1 Tax=Portibacter lacus TaxID=1099794 RepID=A0AA37SQ13_9BACT|nr:cupin domain-containing protein [Portibacter lacus]GLR18683.1 cupin [Portibacter lacus]
MHDTIKPTKAYWIDTETPWEPVAEGLDRQIMGFDDKIMLVKARFKTGAVGQLHKHYHSQVTYVESGEFEMTIGDDVRIIRKGDSYYIPPHEIHGCICRSPGILIDVFSPAREDFLGHEQLNLESWPAK